MTEVPHPYDYDSGGRGMETRPVAAEGPEIPDRASKFGQTLLWYEFYKGKDPGTRAPQDQEGLERSQGQLKELMEQAEKANLLDDVRERAQDLIARLRNIPEGQGDEKSKQRSRLVELRGYAIPVEALENNFWSKTYHRDLYGNMAGIRVYLYESILQAAEKDFEGEALSPESEVGDKEYQRIKKKVERERAKEAKFQTNQLQYVEFHWAQNKEDLISTVDEWIAHVEAENIPDEAVADVYNAINEKRREGLKALDQAKVRLNIPDGDPVIASQRAKIEARLDVTSGDRTVNRGGWEHFLNDLNHFGNNFQAHYDAIYLDELNAMVMEKLGDQDGEYWRGGKDDILRPTEGQMARYQRDKEEGIFQFLMTHSLFLTDKDFKNRNLGSSDEIEQKLLAKDVFIRTKKRLDGLDGLEGLTREERSQRMLDKIIERVLEVDEGFHNSLPQDPLEREKALWGWVDRQRGSSGWFPSRWDMVRLSIDRPAKVLDRALTKDEFEDMYVGMVGENKLFPNWTDEKIKALRTEDGQLTQAAKDLGLEDPDEVDEILDNRESRRRKIRQAIKTSKSFLIFTGYASRVAGTRLKVLKPTGERDAESGRPFYEVVKIKPMYKEIRDRIDKTYPPGDKRLKVRERLKELGLARILPVWHDYLASDDQAINVFAKVLGWDADDKADLIKDLENERKRFQDIIDEVAMEYMGTYLTRNEKGEKKEYRARINHKGGNIDLRKIFFARMLFSTSGGKGSKALVPYMDLGVWDLFWEMGCENAREFTGFYKRRDESELAEEGPLFNILDPIDYWKRLAGADTLKKMIAGGKVGDKEVDGFLNGPLSGSFLIRDFLLGEWVDAVTMAPTEKYRRYLTEHRMKGVSPDPAEIERMRIDTYRDFDFIKPEFKDKFILEGMKVLAPLIDVMKHGKYIENRMEVFDPTLEGRWKERNTKLWFAFRNWLRNNDKEYSGTFDFAEEARSELAIRIYEVILDGAEHLIFPEDMRNELFGEDEMETIPAGGYSQLYKEEFAEKRRVKEEKIIKAQEKRRRRVT